MQFRSPQLHAKAADALSTALDLLAPKLAAPAVVIAMPEAVLAALRPLAVVDTEAATARAAAVRVEVRVSAISGIVVVGASWCGGCRHYFPPIVIGSSA